MTTTTKQAQHSPDLIATCARYGDAIDPFAGHTCTKAPLPMVAECDRLRALNARLVEALQNNRIDALPAENERLRSALQRCLTHFEKIRDQQADPSDSPIMAQARAALTKAKP